jgi:hypothetical protein
VDLQDRDDQILLFENALGGCIKQLYEEMFFGGTLFKARDGGKLLL